MINCLQQEQSYHRLVDILNERYRTLLADLARETDGFGKSTLINNFMQFVLDLQSSQAPLESMPSGLAALINSVF